MTTKHTNKVAKLIVFCSAKVNLSPWHVSLGTSHKAAPFSMSIKFYFIGLLGENRATSFEYNAHLVA